MVLRDVVARVIALNEALAPGDSEYAVALVADLDGDLCRWVEQTTAEKDPDG